MIVNKVRILMLHISVTLFGLTLGCLVLEAGMRMYYFSSEHQLLGLKPARTTLKFYDSDIFGSALVPNQKGWFVPHTKEYFTWVEVNAQG